MKGCKPWLLAMSLCAPLAARAVEPESCMSVRFASVGWTDIAVITAVARQVLGFLGYKTKVDLLSMPVTHRSPANNDLDAFLGNWVPTVTDDIEQYAEKGTAETLRANLGGAKYTLVVPRYVYNGGLRSFADIAKFSDKLGNKIYGIEPGNDGNRVAQSMIDKNTFELDEFKLAESSETGMLLQMQRATRHNQWAVFLGWEPHPMSARFQMKYLGGGDDSFGFNYGGAVVYTSVRKDYAQECVSVGQLLKNLSFTPEMKDKLMDVVPNENKKPEEAAKAWLKNHPEQLDVWPAGIITRNGQPTAATAKLASAEQATNRPFPALDGP